MLTGIQRLTELTSSRFVALTGATLEDVSSAVRDGDVAALARTDGHFAVVGQDENRVRLARTIGLPLRYLVAKMFHGPYLVVSDRIDAIFEWCRSESIDWQFDPSYTRMIPAHHLVEIEQIGCPDPAPRHVRFFEPEIGRGPADDRELGAGYAHAALEALKAWLAGVPAGERIALAFSGGVDSTAVLLLARSALEDLGRDPSLLHTFTLDLGGGLDARQAERSIADLGLSRQWERIVPDRRELDLAEAIRAIEDYHPLDVECAAASLALLGEVRARHPDVRYLLDGDGGDESWKSYPLEDSDLTISSILKNPLLYHEGWGVDALKHSPTYSGGLSRAYVRTYAPARRFGFEAFSPFTVRSVIAAALRAPFEALAAGDPETLCALKGRIVSAGVEEVTGVRMPVAAKRRFQDGVAGDSSRRSRASKASCRRMFLAQWEERLKAAWHSPRRSGNEVPADRSRSV